MEIHCSISNSKNDAINIYIIHYNLKSHTKINYFLIFQPSTRQLIAIFIKQFIMNLSIRNYLLNPKMPSLNLFVLLITNINKCLRYNEFDEKEMYFFIFNIIYIDNFS